MIVRMVEEKKNEEEDLIELRVIEEMVPRRFHKYLKVFEKKDSERMLTRKTWDYAIDLREGFVLKKGKIYPVTNFIQLISPQPVDRFSQTKLLWKAPNEGYLYKSNNE